VQIAPSPTPASCALVAQWKLDPTFAAIVARLRERFLEETGLELEIISGFRSSDQQAQLILAGSGAPQDLSNHTLCPAHAVDVWFGTIPTAALKWTLGRLALEFGLRWGGCDPSREGCINQDSGMPQDWNHLDDGPRSEKG